jgi:hypothetical protein
VAEQDAAAGLLVLASFRTFRRLWLGRWRRVLRCSLARVGAAAAAGCRGARALFVRVVLAAVVVEAAGLVCSASGPPAASVTAAVSVFVGSRRRCCCWRRSPCAPPAARSGSPGAGTPSRSPDSLPSISRALHAKKSLISIRSVTWLETVRQVRHTLLDATYRTQLCHHLG